MHNPTPEQQAIINFIRDNPEESLIVDASRLYAIASALGEPLAAFLSSLPVIGASKAQEDAMADLRAFVATRQGAKLMRHWQHLKPHQRIMLADIAAEFTGL